GARRSRVERRAGGAAPRRFGRIGLSGRDPGRLPRHLPLTTMIVSTSSGHGRGRPADESSPRTSLSSLDGVQRGKAGPGMGVDSAHVGRRVREIRTWRDMSITATAGLAGISQSYLSMIELGQRPVTKRAVLEGLAHALKVSPAEFVDKPWERGTTMI